MKEVFYKKQGRRYVPVSEYDHELCGALPNGTHLVMSYPGGQSTRYNIDPAYAPMIAASRVAEDAMTTALLQASEMIPKRKTITVEQQQAWRNLQQAFDDDMFTLQTKSCRDIVQAGIEALQAEADKLLTNPAVKLAYEHFLMVAELSKEHE